MKRKLNDRKIALSAMSMSLTILTVVAIVIFNIAFSALAYKFSLYTQMSKNTTYDVGDECIEYIENTVIPKINDGEAVKIYFCDDEDVIEADDEQSQILYTARQIEKNFDGKIKVEFLNVWENPKIARKYGITSSSDVAIVYGESFHVISKSNFYLWNTEAQLATAYNGDKRFAGGLLRVVRADNPMCYVTVNHGETLESYDLLYAIADAGYNYNYLDLLSYDIPEDCDLLLTFDPKQDLTAKNSISGISETEKIQNYIQNGGNFWFFGSANTFTSGSLDEFENILATYGVKFAHSENAEGIEECLQIKDTSHSTSVDGYTILSRVADNDVAKNTLGEIRSQSVFANATAIKAADGFAKQNDGSFISEDGKITLSPLLVAYDGAEGWANGRIAEKSTKDSPFTLMSLSSINCDNGKVSSVMVCTSTAFTSEDAMQSASYGNTATLTAVSKHAGNPEATIKLTSKPFPSTDMKTLSVKNAAMITIASAIIPSIAIAIAGSIILIKRKNRA